MPDRAVAIEVIGEANVNTEVITNYTQADIDASNGNLVAIGATSSLRVMGAYSEDGTTLTITKNIVDGDLGSDGVMMDWAFANAYGVPQSWSSIKSTVTTVIIKEGVSILGLYALSGDNANYTSITLPESLLEIGGGAFYYTGFETIVIPNNVTTIGADAFAYSSLKNVTLGSGVTSIAARAFEFTSVNEITYNGTMVQWNEITLEEGWINGSVTIHCTDGDITIS